jgi:uracil-DNA glycosylase
MPAREDLAALLHWYVAMGVDDAIDALPNNRLAAQATAAPARTTLSAPPAPTPTLTPAPAVLAPGSAGASSARQRAAAAATLKELEEAVASFDGCALRRTATHTVFADGTAHAPVMIIGEAPGADEDRIGRPFVGRSGQLLDRMLASIGLDRQHNVYITNVLFWRPPGNRKPTEDEIAACLPFVWRHIALNAPKVLVLCGGTATSALLGRSEGITKLRGRWFDLTVPGLDHPIPTLTTYHPSFLLRAPGRKSESWRDFLDLQSKISSS